MTGFSGMPVVLRQIQLYRDAMSEEMGQGAREEAEQILLKALPITPRETGALRRSGKVIGPIKRNQHVQSVSITFGDEAVDYAVYVHEDPTANHAPPTTYKFLEKAWQSRINGMAARIGRRAQRIARQRARIR